MSVMASLLGMGEASWGILGSLFNQWLLSGSFPKCHSEAGLLTYLHIV